MGRKVALVDYPDDEEPEHVSYCRKCLEYGFQVALKNRIYPNCQPLPPDHEDWLQCHQCGDIVPIYEKKNEAMIKDFVETVENPFDVARSQFLTVDSRAMRKKNKRLADINDPDLKRELASGQTKLLSYTENLN